MTTFNASGIAASPILSSHRNSFLTSVSAGALISRFSAPFGDATVYSLVGTVPGQLAMSNGTIVAGASAAIPGTSYSVRVRAEDPTATRAIEETFVYSARSPAVTLNRLTLASLNAPIASAFSSTISGQTAGSTLTATSRDGTVLSISSGILSGTFPRAGAPIVSITETLPGASNSPRTTEIVLTVAAGTVSPLTIAGTLTSATVGTSTAFAPTIAGGTPPYSLTLASGTLPAGRTISGLSVSGTYTTAATYSYALRVTDAAGQTADLSVGPVVVGAALAISGTLTSAVVGTNPVFSPTITGGTAPYTLSQPSGTLPPGRTLSGLTVTGTYSTAGSYSYTLRVTDAAGATADLAVGPVVVSAAVQPLTFVSNNNHIENSRVGNAGGNVTNFANRWAHYLPKDTVDVQFSFRNYYLSSSSTSTTANTDAVPIAASYAECNGQVVQMTYAGSTSVTLASGDHDIRCQTLTPAMFGFSGGVFPAGTTIWTKTIVQMATSAQRLCYGPRNALLEPTGSVSWQYDPATATIGNLTGAGALTYTGTGLTVISNGIAPFCIGHLAAASPVWVAIGDSITANTGDASTTRTTSGRGWFDRACYSLNVPCGNLAVHGSGTNAGSADTKISFWYDLGNRGMIYYGNNDFGTATAGTSTTATAVRDKVTNRLTQLKASGSIKKVGFVKLGPSALSSNAFVDKAGQTPYWVAGGPIDTFNALDWISLGFDLVVPNDANRDATDSHYWYTNGTANLRVSDYVHPSTGGAIALAAEAQPLMSAIG